MAIPVWPEINFFAENGSWNLTLSDGASNAVTDMDNGQSRIRRRFTQTSSPMTFDVVLDREELEIFKYFYREVLKNGALWFYMPTLDGGDYRINLVRFASGAGPAIKGVGYRTYSASISLTVRELTLIDRDTYEYFARLGNGPAAQRLGSVVEEFVNVVYPSIVGV